MKSRELNKLKKMRSEILANPTTQSKEFWDKKAQRDWSRLMNIDYKIKKLQSLTK